MKKIILTLSVLLTLIFNISIVSAEDDKVDINNNEGNKPKMMRPEADRENIKKLREQNREEIKKIREDFQTTVKENRSSSTEILKEKRQELIKSVQEKRDIFKDEIMSLKEQNKVKTNELKTQLKTKISVIKDENKKIKIENIANNISDLSVKFTNNVTSIIDRIEAVLIAIESRTDKANLNNKDVSQVRALISTAETSIADTRLLITNQISKTYIITGTDEATIKASLQANRDQLKKDIQVINDKIKLTRDAVKKANEALKLIPNINDIVSTTTVNK